MSVTWAVDAGDGARGPGAAIVVPAASTVKPLIALAFWRDVAAGRLDAREEVDSPPPIGDGAILDVLPGLRASLAHHCALMLCVSDNAATNVLIDRLGFERIAEEADRLSLASTRVVRRMCDWDAVAAGRDNETSAADLARLCRVLADPSLVPAGTAEPILDALGVSQHLDILGEVAPPGTLHASKRGTTERAEHDCGLLGGPSGPVGVAVCSSPPASPDALRRAARSALAAAGIAAR